MMPPFTTQALSLVLLVLSVACAKKNPAYQQNSMLRNLPNVQASTPDTSPPINLSARNVQVTYPNPRHQGKIILEAADAAVVYDVLNIEAVNDVKAARAINCTRTNCEVLIDYLEGGVVTTNATADEDITIGASPRNYNGALVRTRMGRRSIQFNLASENALIVYQTLNAAERENPDGTKEKRGEHYTCTARNTTGRNVYSCRFTMNLAGEPIELSP